MMERLDGTVALVTGASSGIGEATARALASQGAAVALAARRKERLEHLAAEIRPTGAQALVLETDVANQAQAEGAVAQTVAELGRLDTVINNAGVMLLGPIEGAKIEEWESMLRVNALGALYIAHAALPHLLRAAAGAPRGVADMVNISSVAGRVARAGAGVYDVTKFGLGAFSESLRQEVTRRHVRVSLVEPGLVTTELAEHLSPEARKHHAEVFRNVEPMEAEDIAEVIVYIVTRPRRVAVNEILVRPTEQVR